MISRDRMTNASAAAVAEAAMSVIDVLQTRRPEVQPLGLAAAFIMLLERLGLEPQDVATLAGNIIAGPDGTRIAEFRALQLYIQNEVNP